jgi:hypothetical protein
MTEALRKPGARLTTTQALLLGGLTVAVLDILDAFVFFGIRDVAPARILQSIAAGLLGRASFEGGLITAAIGLVLHFTIAFTIVLVYFAASRVFHELTRRPWLWGPVYGLVVYVVMNFVVIPLSATARGNPGLPVVVNGLLIHLVGVGLPAALFSRSATQASHSPSRGLATEPS